MNQYVPAAIRAAVRSHSQNLAHLYEIIFRFSWEKFKQASVYGDKSNAEHDEIMDEGVEAIRTIYKRYQRLN